MDDAWDVQRPGRGRLLPACAAGVFVREDSTRTEQPETDVVGYAAGIEGGFSDRQSAAESGRPDDQLREQLSDRSFGLL